MKKQTDFKSETEVAEIIIPYLKEMKWEIYQEVQPRHYSDIADIVAIQGNLVWVLECKRSFSLNVISQAYNWKYYAHYVSIVIPYLYRDKNHSLKKKILDYFGIGCYQVSKGYYEPVKEFSPVKLNRKADGKFITLCLTEQHKTWAKAGNANGDRYTPFQNTKRQLIQTVKKNPGISMKELIKSIDHHYASDSSAKGSLLQWIHKGVIKELQLKQEGRSYKIYLKEK